MVRTIRNCNVAVVGGAGFLGSHLVQHLIEDRECEVLVLDNLCAGRREFIHPKAFFEYADVTGSEIYLRRLFEEYDSQYVLNYSAIPYIPVSFDRPLHVFDVNAFGALKVINAAQEAGAKGILQVSSAEIFGGVTRVETTTEANETWKTFRPPQLGDKINEDHPVQPHSSYGASKAAIDYLVQARWREARTPCIALRQFNCLGERDSLHPYVAAEIIKQVWDGRSMQRTAGLEGDNADPITVWLGNNSLRDFMYAGDAVRMAVELLEKGKFGEVYNLGSEEGIKIYDLARLIGKIMEVEVRVEPDPSRYRPWEIWHLCSQNSKIHNVVDYRPQVNLEEGLRRMIRWYEENGKKWAWE